LIHHDDLGEKKIQKENSSKEILKNLQIAGHIFVVVFLG